MADYPNRPAELTKFFEDKRKEVTDKERSGGPAVVLSTWSFFELRLKEYIDWREKVLVEGLPLVKAGNDATGRDVQGKWTDYFKNKGSEAFQKVQKFLSNPEPTLQPLVETMCAQESTFFTMIADMPMAQFQGEIREDIKALRQKKDDWVREWATFVGLDKQRDEDYKRFRDAVMDESRKIVADLLGAKKLLEDFQEHVLPTIVDKAVGLAVDATGLPPIISNVVENAVGKFLGNLLEATNKMKPTMDQYVGTAERLSYDRKTIARAFQSKREDVKWITTRYNPDLVVKRYDEQSGKARDLASKAGSKDQVEDAKKLAEKIISETKQVVDDYKSCYNEFYSALDGTLVGRISDNTREQLAEAGFMQAFFDDFQKMNLYPGFQETLKDVAMVMDVNLDKLNEGSRRGLKDYLRMKFVPLQDNLRGLGESFFTRFGKAIIQQKNEVMDSLRS
jgi:hypothetical protein